MRQILICTTVGLLVCACTPNSQDNSNSVDPQFEAPTQPGALGENPQVTTAVLTMPASYLAEALQSFEFKAEVKFRMSRGGKEFNETENHTLKQDALGNFYVQSLSEAGQAEAWRVDGADYIRYDKAAVRTPEKPLNEHLLWRERVYGTLYGSLEPFLPYVSFQTSESTQSFANRNVYVVELGLSSTPLELEVPPHLLGRTPEISARSTWRDQSKAVSLKGRLLIDEEKGVILDANIEGRLDLPKISGEPTTLTLRYRSSISKIASSESVKAPKARREYRRQKPPRDPISFFRHRLPKEAVPEPSP